MINMQVESNSESPCAIFWDIENICVPKATSTRTIVEIIRRDVLKPNSLKEVDFYCVCDALKLSPRITEELNLCGVTVVHINSISKNAADDKLKELMIKFVDYHGHKSSLVLLSGDVNFVTVLRGFQRRHDATIYLIHPDKASRDLVKCADKIYSFSQLLNGLSRAGSVNSVDSSSEFGPAHVQITGLPLDCDRKGLAFQLKVMSNNCGGKVIDINNGIAWIRFSCKSDAQRAVQRMNGLLLNGKTLKASLINGLAQSVAPLQSTMYLPLAVGPPSNPTSQLSQPSPVPFSFNHELQQLKSGATGNNNNNNNNSNKREKGPLGTLHLNSQENQQPGINLTATTVPKEQQRSSHQNDKKICDDLDQFHIKQILKPMLKPLKGRIIGTEDSKVYVKFPVVEQAYRGIAKLDNISMAGLSINARLVRNNTPKKDKVQPIELAKEAISQMKHTNTIKVDKVPEEVEDEDVVYLGSKAREKIYLSVTYGTNQNDLPPAPGTNDLLNVAKLGVLMVLDCDGTMWFEVPDDKKGEEAMEKFSTLGYPCYLARRLPESVKNTLASGYAKEVMRGKSLITATNNSSNSTKLKEANRNIPHLMVTGLSGKLTLSQAQSRLKPFIDPFNGNLIRFTNGSAYVKFNSVIDMLSAFTKMQGQHVDGSPIFPIKPASKSSQQKSRFNPPNGFIRSHGVVVS